MPVVRFPTRQLETTIAAGATIFDAATRLGILLDSDCGGAGTCGQCKVIVFGDAGALSEAERALLTESEIKAGVRLACQVQPQHDVQVIIPDSRGLERAKEALAGDVMAPIELAPYVRKLYVELPHPSLTDQRSDWERVRCALEAYSIQAVASREVLLALPHALRAEGFKVTAISHGNRLSAIEAGDTRHALLAAAVDIGTTTIAVYLLDLRAGRQVDVAAAANPQGTFGADVISRITAAMNDPAALSQMQALVIQAIDELIARLCAQNGLQPTHVYEIVLAGNTCMMELAVGAYPEHLALAPYIPVFTELIDLPAAELGFHVHPQARVCLLPGIGGYVGADIVADILFARMHELPGVRLLIDIGTNGEIVLARDGEMMACATAAGPAFEGAHIACGSRAIRGAIEHVSQDGQFELQVIGATTPSSICGSGLMDAVAAMLRAGVIDRTGRLRHPSELPSPVRERMVSYEGQWVFQLYHDAQAIIYLSQKDIRQVQMAKGAMRAGIEMLMAEMGIEAKDIDEVLLAGAFGSYISPASVLQIDLLPPVPLEAVRAIGNAAGEGAKLAAWSTQQRSLAEAIARRVRYIELSARPDFQEVFVRQLGFASAL